MVNRTMQAKMLKGRRQRRAWAKSYSMKLTGPAKLPGVVADERSYFTKSSGGRFVDPWLEKLFPDNNPLYTRTESNGYLPNEEGIHARAQGSNAVPRAVVLAKLIQSTSNAGSMQGEATFHYVKLIHGRFNELRLYMGGNQYFFIEMVTRGAIRKIRRSIMYGDKDRALFQFRHGKICFQEPISEAIPPRAVTSQPLLTP